MDEYRKALPLVMPDKQERTDALGTLVGEKYTLKKTFKFLQQTDNFKIQEQQGKGEWMFENEVDGQPFGLYTSSFINYLDSQRNTIYIIKLHCNIPDEKFKIIKQGIKYFFQGAKVKFWKPKQIIDYKQGTFYSKKFDLTAYDSQKILQQMQRMLPQDAYCLIALTDLLFYNLPSDKSLFANPVKVIGGSKEPDDWTIFGLANIKDRVGIVNTKRFFEPLAKFQEDDYSKILNQEEIQKIISIKQTEISQSDQQEETKSTVDDHLEDQEQDEQQILWKDLTSEQRRQYCHYNESEAIANIVKVVNHEICHMFGIRHCIYYQCIMNGSSYRKHGFQDFHNKPLDLCIVCLRKLQYNMNFDVAERYQKLADFCKKYVGPFEKYIAQYEEMSEGIQMQLKTNQVTSQIVQPRQQQLQQPTIKIQQQQQKKKKIYKPKPPQPQPTQQIVQQVQ